MLPGLSSGMLVVTAPTGGAGGAAVVLNSETIEHIVADPANATATLSLNSSGTVTGTGIAAYNWRLAGSSADYDVSFDGGASWLNLATTRTISRTRTNIGVNTGTYDVRIRNAATLVELAAASITLYAEVG